MIHSDSTFATNLYGQLRQRPGNLFFSPTSVRIALAMTLAGARGETASEMVRVLALPQGWEAHAAFAALLRSWDSFADPRVVLRISNRLWAQSGYNFHHEFLALLRDEYRAPLAQLDFRHSAESCRAEINQWVSEQTEGKIRALLPPNTVSANTRMLLTNAVYFKARWTSPFLPSATQTQPFFVAADQQVPVPLMRQVRSYRFAAFDDGQMLELPYAYGELVMNVVLPTKRDGLGRIERQFIEGNLSAWLGALKAVRVDVQLPRFKTSSELLLAEALGALGMGRAFRYRDADFSGIDGTRELVIDAAMHRAVVDVDENGTEAAAATAVRSILGSLLRPEPDPIVFRADHPFLFLIRDSRNGAILFAGRMVNPRS